jgi:hypothetical protein
MRKKQYKQKAPPKAGLKEQPSGKADKNPALPKASLTR